MRFAFIAVPLLGLLAGSACFAQTAETPFSVPPADAPELAARGLYSVGVRTLDLIHHGQIDILHFDAKTGTAPKYDRPLAIEVWYPAIILPGQTEAISYTMGAPSEGGKSSAISFAGKALRDAPPVTGSRFPLVIVSHGYPGSRFFLTYLTENLASKGYVVAAVDHTDSVIGHIQPFPSTLLNRSADQLFAIESLGQLASTTGSFLSGLLDVDKTAIVGYSMGGYGALISAGAGLSAASPLTKAVPGNYLDAWTANNEQYKALRRESIRCIVAIAPWGEQPPYKAWDAEGLAGISVPSLFIAGDQDDVADYPNGIKPAFEAAIHSDRYLLTYQNARHNTGGNPPPPGIRLNYGQSQFFEEPVWRKDRIDAINQHFITAFLDAILKGDTAKRRYLDLPIVIANEGKWKQPESTRDTGQFSTGRDAEGNPFWTGFQRRWALGLTMQAKPATAKRAYQE